ncbi:metalloregulator ArsR/SmtB family transcription factor [Leptothermofonsia sp. ETS-13]|uniref:ArsR/SmtB family transcription factor n=1 Tax=Leptothermofonsia sp. ETS-13 TaxID=3035696 RepID=UPI003BA29108
MINEDTARYADVFAALGSEPRLEIMRLLFAAHPNGLTVGELQSQLHIPNSTLSHHLEKLRVEGLVSSRRDRQFLWYSANVETVEELLSFLYNGCSLSNPILTEQNSSEEAEDAYQSMELAEESIQEEGLMFQRFLWSMQKLLGELFGFTALPRGFEKFTQKAIQTIFLAQNETRRLQHRYVGTEQILLGLIEEGTGIAAQVLTRAGVHLEAAQQRVEHYIGRGSGTQEEIPFTPRAKKALWLAVDQSHQLGHSYIGTEHLLLGLLQEGKGLGARVLEDLGVNLRSLEQQVHSAIN